jgi:uncharacterized membrane protein HdeD (DUF308 family)
MNSNEEEITMNKSKSNNHKDEGELSFWISLIRAAFAIILGLSLLVIPEKTGAMLLNFMSFFWITSGIVSIRHELRPRGNRLILVVGFIGVLAGMLMITRNLTRHLFSENLVIIQLGTIMSLTGILHVGSGFRFGKQAIRGRTTLSVMLGVFEIILGILILFSDGGRSPTIYWIAIIWSLLGGALLIGDAFRQRGQRKSNE